MYNRLPLFFILSILTCTSFGFTYKQTANRLITKIDPHIHMSMMVKDLNTNKTLFERNANQALIPASNMKLFSQAIAIMALGQQFQFRNTLSTDATRLENNTLYGSVYLNLPGDPSLTSQDVQALLATLSNWGIRKIEGNVVIVSPKRFISPYAPGRMPEDIPRSYGASVAPVVINENNITISVNPRQRNGGFAYISFGDPFAHLNTNNQIKTSTACKRPRIGLFLNTENHLFARGCISPTNSASLQRIAILNPSLYAKSIVKNMLTSAHISLSGTVLIGGAPKSTMLLASHSSEPLSKLMADTLKPSDNVYADSLFLHTVAYLNGSPLNWDRAQSVAKTFLQHQTGIDFSNAVMIDGSGLSRFNRVSAKQTVALLSYIYTHFSIAQDYIAALPIAGVDGTLEHRFRKPGMQGLIRAKTGYMKGIFGLSGYAFTPNGHTLAFSIYINRIGKSNATGSYRGLIDQLCEIMVKLTPTGGQAFRPQNINPTLAFQYRPSTPAASRATSAKWRQLETALRHALNNQPVSITYHANSLVLQDSSSNAHMVLAALQGLAQKYAFAVALESSTLSERNGHLRLMWIKNNQSEGMRIWKIFPTVN